MKILVVDDHPLVRDALRENLRQLEHGVEVLEACSSEEALALAGQHSDLDLVLLDLHLPDARGSSALIALRERHPEIPVVVLSAQSDRGTVLEALDKGAMGFVPKTAGTQVILGALRLVLSGGIYLPTEVLSASPAGANAGNRFEPAEPDSMRLAKKPVDLGLTPRQAQILALLVQGKPNKIISRELGLAESTVKIHITSILRALNVSNRVQAVIAVGRMGLQLGTMPQGSNAG
jgi:DNA-binding NarL/FixJ family response regulator